MWLCASVWLCSICLWWCMANTHSTAGVPSLRAANLLQAEAVVETAVHKAGQQQDVVQNSMASDLETRLHAWQLPSSATTLAALGLLQGRPVQVAQCCALPAGGMAKTGRTVAHAAANVRHVALMKWGGRMRYE